MTREIQVFTGVLLALLVLRAQLVSQTLLSPSYFQRFGSAPAAPAQIPGAEKLQEHIVGGKVRLSLREAIRLAFLNNTEIRLNELQLESSRFSLLRTYQPFDPLVISTYRSTRDTSPTSSQLEGGQEGSPRVTNQSQITQFAFSQILQTGTRYDLSFNTGRRSTDNRFVFVNPSVDANVNFSLAQPLLRNRGFFVNRAPIVIAQRDLERTQADFEVLVNDVLEQAVNQYWLVIQARENLRVLGKSLELAEATYQRNKRELELGALPPLESIVPSLRLPRAVWI